MKLSELTTERAADVLCELTPFVTSLLGDKALLDTLREKLGGQDHSLAELYAHGAQKLSALAPILLKEHRDDLFGILAVLQETTPKAIASQSLMLTLEQLCCALQDKELADFFKSWQQGESR